MAEWRAVAGKPYLLVTRYDRLGPEGSAIRLHQEDFAQALGVPSNRKYASEGGPTFRDGFALLRQAATRPARERSEEHTSELQSLMRISYAVFCLKKTHKTKHTKHY